MTKKRPNLSNLNSSKITAASTSEITIDIEPETVNKLYLSLLQNTSDLITSLDGNGKILFANQTWLNKVGYTLDEVLRTPIFNYIHPDHINHCTSFFSSLQQNKTEIAAAYSLISKTGKEIQIEGKINTLFKNGQLYKINTHFKDVTEVNSLKTSEQQSKKTLQIFKDAIDVSAIVSITDHKGAITYVNDNFCAIFGYTAGELLYQNHRIISSGYHDRSFFKELWKTISSGQIWKGVIKNKSKKGDIYWVDSTIVPIPSSENNYEYISIRYNITKEYETERKKNEQKKFYESILNNLPGNITVFDINGKYIFASPYTIKDTAIRQWIIGKDSYDYCRYVGLPTELADEKEKRFKLLRENKPCSNIIEEKKSNNNNFEYYESRMSLFEFEGQKYIIEYALDITPLKKAEEEIMKLKMFYENILHNIPVDIAVFDKNHKYIFLNREAIKDDALRTWMVGKDDFDYAALKGLPESFAQKRRDSFNKVLNSAEDLVWLDKQVTKHGDVKYKERRFHTFANRETVIGYAVDVTKLHSIQLELYKSREELLTVNKNLENEIEKRIKELKESNTSLESFAYSISHDLKAPLRQIGSFTGLLKKSLNKGNTEAVQEHFKYIENSVSLLSERINALLQFSKYGTDQLCVTEFALRNEIDKAFYLYIKNYNQNNYTFINHIQATVFADRSLIGAVIENLISNSIKYSIPKKHIFIEAGEELINNKVVYYIRDKGVGFEMKYYNKIFALFQRLHHNAEIEGMGIGLSHVKRIIERHNGDIWAESAVGEGTTFYFTLNLK